MKWYIKNHNNSEKFYKNGHEILRTKQKLINENYKII